jgi:hypothetical protein
MIPEEWPSRIVACKCGGALQNPAYRPADALLMRGSAQTRRTPRQRGLGEEMTPQPQKTLQDRLIEEWVGAWALEPSNEPDRRAAEIARACMKFTKSASFISPVAVASIDILGIKSVLSKMSMVEVAERFAEPFYDLTSPAYNFGKIDLPHEELEQLGFRRMAAIYSVSISDTILLVRRPDWELGNRAIAEAQAVVAMAEHVCKIMRINSFLGVPLRGAIAFGECLISVGENRALLGLATGEASAWERGQEWIGGMLTPSAVGALRDGAEAAKAINGPDFEPKYPNTLTSYAIPLKSGCPTLPQPQIALNWITGMLSGGAMLFGDGIIPDQSSEALPDDVRRKRENTVAFIDHCKCQPLYSSIKF